MRRTIRYTAGLMIAAGATLAFAGPAAAAEPWPFANAGTSVPNVSVNVPVQVGTSVATTLTDFAKTQVGSGNFMGGSNTTVTQWTGQFMGGFGN